MTVSTTNSKVIYNGGTSTRYFAYTFPIIETTDIKIYVTDDSDNITEVTTNYTVDTVNSRIIYPTVESGLPYLPTGYKITINREVPLEQDLSLTRQGPLDSENLETAYDKLTLVAQQLQEQIDRAIIWRVDEVPSTTDREAYLAQIQAERTLAQTARAAAELAETNSETAQGLSEVAQAASEAAQGLSETAQGLSEAAKVLSESARDTSIAARDAAIVARDLTLGYRNSAEGFKNDASGYATNAGLAATESFQYSQNALSYKNAAELAETNAETAQGLAETAQGLSETAQGLSETAQGLSEGARDTAIAQAAIATSAASEFRSTGRFGFVSASETSYSFNDTTYIFTLTDASGGSGWRYFRSGQMYTITGNKTVTLAGTPPTADRYFIYIDDNIGTLSYSTTAWTLLDTKVPVCIVTFNNANTPKYFTAEERHSSLWDRRVHYYMHTSTGTRYVSGGTLSGHTIANASPVDTHNTFSISETYILDEDLNITNAVLADGDGTTNNYTIFFRTAASTWSWERSPVPFRYTGGGYIQYDNSGTMTQGSANNFYNYYLVYTNLSSDGRFVMIPGRAAFANLATAQSEDFRSFTFDGFGIVECFIAYRITFETKSSYTTKGQCRIAATAQWVGTSLASVAVSSSADHNSLLNLQGGTTNQYYHLTDAEYKNLSAVGINFLTGSSITAAVDVGDWVAYADAAAAIPTDMTGGSPTLTITRTTSSPLKGVGSFLITKPASNVQGEGASIAYSIDAAHKGEAAMFQCYVETDTNYVDESLEVFVYDVTNAALVYTAPSKLKKSLIVERPFFEFQFPINSTSYRIGFHVNSTSTTAYTVKFDLAEVKPKQVTRQAVVTDWVSFTPTGSWVNVETVYTGFWRRKGDTAEYDIKVTTGAAPTSASLTVNLASGHVIDTTKLAVPTTNNIILGTAMIHDQGTDDYHGLVAYSSTTKVTPATTTVTGTKLDVAGITQAAPITFAANDFVHLKFSVPIVGWSSATQVTDTFTGRTIAADMYLSGNQTIGPNASAIQINLNAYNNDTVGMVSTSSYNITIPRSDWYDINACIAVGGGNVLANEYYAMIKSGATVIAYGHSILATVGKYFQAHVSRTKYLTAGSVITLHLYGDGNNSASTLTVDGSTNATWLSVCSRSNPNQVLANEKVVAIYTDTGGASLQSGNSTGALLPWGTKVVDSHNGMSAGIYTVPKTLQYRISSTMFANAMTMASQGGLNIHIYKNGAEYRSNYTYNFTSSTAASSAWQISITAIVNCIAGETISIYGGSYTAATRGGTAYVNDFSIESI